MKAWVMIGVDLTMAVQRLEKAKRTDDTSKALLARFAVACPGDIP